MHVAICLWATRNAIHSVIHDQWNTLRLPEELVRKRGDFTLKRRRRAAQVTQMLGAGYTPRITFLAVLMLRSLQMATGIRHVFDPSLAYAAGATLAAQYSCREWIPTILLGWGVGGVYWSAFRVQPPVAVQPPQ